MRELKGLEIAARSKIAFKDGAWLVPSQSGTAVYKVVLKPDGDTCPCEDFTLRGGPPCKHIHAARLARERDHGGQSPVIDTEVVPKKPTYSQNWTAYNLAQMTEKNRLQTLLYELCRGVPEPERPANLVGRKPVPLADQVFACAFKIYSTFSSRRFACDLNDAHAKGYLSRPIHPNKVNTFLESKELTPILKRLIVQASLPLRTVEVDFAADSTGFSTSRFVKWYDEKYGVTRSGHDWVKAHIACGVKTNVVTAVVIEGRHANDCPMLPELAKTTAENFTINEFSGDKGYLSVENIETIFALGGTPFIPFKVNSTEGSGGLWEKMFHFYSFNRDEFLAHYHKRSNAESTFSMVKAKFRDHVRSRTDTAMTNEVLCKLLCHNLCCLIQSQCELGIEPVFWGEAKPPEAPAILPLVRPG